jgi:galactose-1-phosphate uridylyltransferase
MSNLSAHPRPFSGAKRLGSTFMVNGVKKSVIVCRLLKRKGGQRTMSSRIQFQTYESKSTFLHPHKGFSPTTERFEVRVDPLTGRTGHFSHFGAIKPQKLDLDAYATPEIKGFCPFCIENRNRVTPKFTDDILAEGRLTRNEACLVPNLFPYDIHSGVIIMTDPHVVPLLELSQKRLFDSLALGIHFLKLIKTIHPSLPYHLMTWNYMPPSGGGLVHPHQQFFATPYPGNQFIDELKASEAFHGVHGSNYWSELIETEQERAERLVGQIGDSYWLSSFVSFGILGELMCIFPKVFTIEQFTEDHVECLVAGLLNIFQYYVATDIFSFNASLFFGSEGQRSFSCHFRIAARTFLNMRDYAPDLNFFQALLGEPVSVMMPEELCTAVKVYF